MVKMRKILGILVLVMMALAPAFAVGGFAQIENVRVGTVFPGGLFTVSFDVHNILNSDVRYVYVKAPSSASFMPVGLDTWASQGEIARDGRQTATFTLKADDNIVAGVYSIPFLLTSEAKTIGGIALSGASVTSLQTLTTTEYVNVKVDGAPSLVVSQKSSVPSLIEAGSPAAVTFDIFNNGSDTARNIAVTVAAPENVDLSSASRSIYVGEIAPKARASFTVGFVADKVAGRTEFSLPMTVAYDGGSFTESAPILLKKSAELEISTVEGTLEKGQNEQKLLVHVRNVGNHDAENIRTTLLADYPLTPSGRDSFIKSLAPGQEAVAIFTVDVDSKGAVQEYPLQVAVTYDEHSATKSDMLSGSVRVAAGKNSYLYWGIGAALFVALVLFIRRPKGGKPIGKPIGKSGKK
jgi:uncharacterized membrane protein